MYGRKRGFAWFVCRARNRCVSRYHVRDLVTQRRKLSSPIILSRVDRSATTTITTTTSTGSYTSSSVARNADLSPGYRQVGKCRTIALLSRERMLLDETGDYAKRCKPAFARSASVWIQVSRNPFRFFVRAVPQGRMGTSHRFQESLSVTCRDYGYVEKSFPVRARALSLRLPPRARDRSTCLLKSTRSPLRASLSSRRMLRRVSAFRFDCENDRTASRQSKRLRKPHIDLLICTI